MDFRDLIRHYQILIVNHYTTIYGFICQFSTLLRRPLPLISTTVIPFVKKKKRENKLLKVLLPFFTCKKLLFFSIYYLGFNALNRYSM